jgi:phytoene dehydrogenase-like protein
MACDYHGRQVSFSRDVVKFEEQLCSLSPEDTRRIKKMCRDITCCSALSMPVMNIPGLKVKEKSQTSLCALMKMLPALIRLASLGRISVRDFAARFRNPAIRFALLKLANGDYDATSLFYTLGCFSSGDGGYVEGGSLVMMQNMAKCFTDLGGTIRYKTKVEKIPVKDGHAMGIIARGETFPADAVIVTADALTAIDTLFEQPLHERWADTMRRVTKPMISTFIGFGIRADLSALPVNMLFPLDRPIEYAGVKIDNLSFNNYAAYPGYAPEGCSAITLILPGDTYDYWKAARDQGVYAQRKEELAEDVLNRLEEQFPLIRGNAVVRDVATPLTYERFCGTFHGSWMTKTPAGQPRRTYSYKAKTMDNVYFAGQRVMAPGGMPVALATGRTAAQYLCRDFNRVFG